MSEPRAFSLPCSLIRFSAIHLSAAGFTQPDLIREECLIPLIVWIAVLQHGYNCMATGCDISKAPFARGSHNIFSTVKNLCKPQNSALTFSLRFFLLPGLMQIQLHTYSFTSQHFGWGKDSDLALLMGIQDTER